MDTDTQTQSVPAQASDDHLRHATAVREYIAPLLAHRQRYVDAAHMHGSPLYLFSEAVVLDRLQRFRDAFAGHLADIQVFYALKSNPHSAIVHPLARAGCGLDASSGRELKLALASDARQIVFSGPGKTDPELLLALQHVERVCVLIDSFGELDRLAHLASCAGHPIAAGVRLTTDERGLWRKFGIPLDRLGEFCERASATEQVTLQGLQFHTSWNRAPGAQVDFIHRLGVTLAGLPPRLRQSIRFLDIGGGYWPQPGEWLHALPAADDRAPALVLATPDGRPRLLPQRLPAVPIEHFAAALGEALRASVFPHVDCQIYAEPGRWLCNDAMHILIQVVDRKADDLVITDAGTNAVGWERFEYDYVPVVNLSHPDTTEHPCLVLGSLCTPHDVWGLSYCGSTIMPGDLLLIPNQGAYTYSLRQEFIKPLPQAVVFPVECA